jgi:hypothetical protein
MMKVMAWAGCRGISGRAVLRKSVGLLCGVAAWSKTLSTVFGAVQLLKPTSYSAKGKRKAIAHTSAARVQVLSNFGGISIRCVR